MGTDIFMDGDYQTDSAEASLLWSTAAELAFVRRLGRWGSPLDRLAGLRQYQAAMRRRADWGAIDVRRVAERVEFLIRLEHQRLLRRVATVAEGRAAPGQSTRHQLRVLLVQAAAAGPTDLDLWEALVWAVGDLVEALVATTAQLEQVTARCQRAQARAEGEAIEDGELHVLALLRTGTGKRPPAGWAHA